MDHIIPLSAGGRSDISNLQPLFWYANLLKGKALLEDLSEKRKAELGCGVQAETVLLFFSELARLPAGRQQEWLEQLMQPTPKPFDNAKLSKQAFKDGWTDAYVREMVDVMIGRRRPRKEWGARALPKPVIDNVGPFDTAATLGDSHSGYRKALTGVRTFDNTYSKSEPRLVTWTTTADAAAEVLETDSTTDRIQSGSGPLDSKVTAYSDEEANVAVAAVDGDYHVARTVVATCQVAATAVLIALSAAMSPGAFRF